MVTSPIVSSEQVDRRRGEKLVDKDQLIEKPEINIVGVIANHQFNWYICSNDMWTMDIDKYIQAY